MEPWSKKTSSNYEEANLKDFSFSSAIDTIIIEDEPDDNIGLKLPRRSIPSTTDVGSLKCQENKKTVRMDLRSLTWNKQLARISDSKREGTVVGSNCSNDFFSRENIENAAVIVIKPEIDFPETTVIQTPQSESITMSQDSRKSGASSKKRVRKMPSNTETKNDIPDAAQDPYNFYLSDAEESVKRQRISCHKRPSVANGNPTKELRPHVCQVCDRELISDIESFKAHLKTHVFESKYLCTLCDTKFNVAESFKAHITTHDKFSCSMCDKEFNAIEAFNAHNLTHVLEDKYMCTTCNTDFSNIESFFKHKMNHFSNPCDLCTMCGQEFCDGKSLATHMQTHSSEVQYVCRTCHHCFAHPEALKQHRETHLEKPPYKCPVCHKSYSVLGRLKQHIIIHRDPVGDHECITCHQVFSCAVSLQRHIRTHLDPVNYDREFRDLYIESVLKHEMTNQKYLCTMCNQELHDRRSLATHKLTHSEEVQYVCPCGNAFRHPEALRQHFKSHLNKRHYKCPVCLKAFSLINSLKVHMVTHEINGKRQAEYYKSNTSEDPDIICID